VPHIAHTPCGRDFCLQLCLIARCSYLVRPTCFCDQFVELGRVHFPSVLWYCWLGLLTCKNRLLYDLYCVGRDIDVCMWKVWSWWWRSWIQPRSLDTKSAPTLFMHLLHHLSIIVSLLSLQCQTSYKEYWVQSYRTALAECISECPLQMFVIFMVEVRSTWHWQTSVSKFLT